MDFAPNLPVFDCSRECNEYISRTVSLRESTGHGKFQDA